MNIELRNIVNEPDLRIKLLTYENLSLAEFDLSILNENELEKFMNFNSDKRRSEFYFTRVLWKLFESQNEILYSSTGKPKLKMGYISISHSKNKIAIGYSSTCEIGLDIEHYNDKIFRIRHKFISEFEKQNFNLDDHKVLTTIWSIKEAIYKLVDVPGLRFKEDINVLEIAKSNRVEVELSMFKKHFIFERKSFKTFILTYCLSTNSK